MKSKKLRLQKPGFAEVTSKTYRASDAARSSCPSKHGWWECERQRGHSGPHLAWANYETGELYEDGRW